MTRLGWATAGCILAVAVAAGGGSYAYVGQQQERLDFASGITGGHVDRAEAEMRLHGCPGCHTIPGVRGPEGQVGPPLQGVSGRIYIGGVLTNTPENMIRWLLDPPAYDHQTAMPNTGLTQSEARDIAAYLYAKS